jgi:tetratricopeptide (TPR) repeat protein
MNTKFRVFVSYTPVDTHDIPLILQALAAEFELLSWSKNDDDQPAGSHALIRRRISTCDAVVFLMTPTSLMSNHCTEACLTARELDKPLFIAQVETVLPGKSWLDAISQQHTDLRLLSANRLRQFTEGITRRLRGAAPALGDPLPTPGKLTGIESLRVALPFLTQTPMFGRDEDLDIIRSMLGTNIIQIVGGTGIGKTRFAAEIALGAQNGVIWHRCTTHSNPDSLIRLLCQHHGWNDSSSLDELLAQLNGRSPVIVIDDVHHLAEMNSERAEDYKALITRLYPHAPVLLTSTPDWLEIYPTQKYLLQPIDLDSAAQLVIEFAELHHYPLNFEQAISLASALRHHPLLIQLTIPLLSHRPYEKLMERLSHLEDSPLEVLMETMIDETIAQMRQVDPYGVEAELLLWQLAIFHGQFSRQAVEALKPDAVPTEHIDSALKTLITWNLLNWEASTGLYALDDLVISALPPHEMTAAKHFAYFYRLHGSTEVNQIEERHSEIEKDWADIQQALAWALDSEQTKPEVMRDGLAFVIALDYPMNFLLSHSEHREWLSQAYMATARLGDAGAQAKILMRLGQVASMQDQLDEAQEFYTQAKINYEGLGDLIGQANTLQRLGEVAFSLGNYADARLLYTQARVCFESAGSQIGQANVLHLLGDVARTQHEYEHARRYYTRAKVMFEHIGSLAGQANMLQRLGYVSFKKGDYEPARSYYEQALVFAEVTGDLPAQLNTLRNWGDLEHQLGHDDFALTCFYKADVLARSNPYFADTPAAQHYRQLMNELQRTSGGTPPATAAVTS